MTINCLGIDPGNNLGIAIIQYEKRFKVIYSHVFDLHKYRPQFNKKTDTTLLPIEFRIIQLESIFKSILDKFQIDLIGCEDAYVNYKFPYSAYSIIRDVILISLVFYYKFNKRTHTIHNKTIKREMISGKATKLDIKQSVLRQHHILFNPSIDKNNLTEHQYDSIAVAYTLIKLTQNFM